MNYLIIHMVADEAIFATFRKNRDGLTFIGASRHPLGDEKDLASLLKENASPGQEACIILSIPPTLISMREVDFPITDRRKVREILPMELKGETAVDTDDLKFDVMGLDDGKMLALWAKRSEITERIAIMASEQMEPEIVTASFCHWDHLLAQEGGSTAVAVTDGASLAVFRGVKPVFFRTLAGNDTATEVARTVAALEIGKGLIVEKLYLHGPAARTPEVFNEESGLRLPVALLPVSGDFAATFSHDLSIAHDLAAVYSLARGSATSELVNFRTGDLAYTAGRQKARRKLLVTAGLAAALVVLLFGELGLRYYLTQRDLTSLNSSIRTIYREIFPDRKKSVDEVAEVKSEIKRLSGATYDSAVLPVLKRLAELKGEDITGIYETEIEGAQVRLKGDARTVQAVNDFKGRASGMFSTAEVGEIKSRPDGSVGFVLRATLKGGEK